MTKLANEYARREDICGVFCDAEPTVSFIDEWGIEVHWCRECYEKPCEHCGGVIEERNKRKGMCQARRDEIRMWGGDEERGVSKDPNSEQTTLLTDGGLDSIDPDEADAGDYLRAVEGGETALHVYLKDDKEWWLAHNPRESPPGALNGPWLLWTTYPTGPWELQFCTREVMHFHVDELYYIDYYGEEAHSVHETNAVPISDAPEFVQAEFVDDVEDGLDYHRPGRSRSSPFG